MADPVKSTMADPSVLTGFNKADAAPTLSPYVKPGEHVYNTPLSPGEEMAFRKWVQDNKVPFDINAKVSSYDMRGFYAAMQRGDPKAHSAVDPTDKRIHYSDYWKTPYHPTFSNESQWATPDAPHWTEDDQLVDKNGKVVLYGARSPAPSVVKKLPNPYDELLKD